MPRAAAIVIQDNAVALIKRQREGRTYYVFPGGGIEQGETPQQSAVREIKEELGLEILITRLIARVNYPSPSSRSLHYYFLAQVTGGCFGSGEGPEMRGLYAPSHGTYFPMWMPLEKLGKEVVYPETVARLVSRSVRGSWPQDVVEIQESMHN